MPERLRMSLHHLADSLRARPNAPLRGLTVGRFVILWDGKRGDYMETASTDDVLGSSDPHWYDTHCPTCDAPEPTHTPTCAVVHRSSERESER